MVQYFVKQRNNFIFTLPAITSIGFVEYHNLNLYHCENLKSHIYSTHPPSHIMFHFIYMFLYVPPGLLTCLWSGGKQIPEPPDSNIWVKCKGLC